MLCVIFHIQQIQIVLIPKDFETSFVLYLLTNSLHVLLNRNLEQMQLFGFYMPSS